MRKLLHGVLALLLACLAGQGADELALPRVGDSILRILAPQLLELVFVNTKAPDPARLQTWNWVNSTFDFQSPAISEFAVTANGQSVPVESVVGFKRRPLYAPIAERDLRIQNGLYLKLGRAIAENQMVEVKNPSARLWPQQVRFVAPVDPLRNSPAIHVNEEGYAPAFPKKAMVGYYLGNAGELDVPAGQGFKLIEANSGAEVFKGVLTHRPDIGYTYEPTPYQEVFEADFSSFTRAGTYRLVVPDLGASLPFRIDDGVPMTFARAYALGLYHQRCGTANALPFTRFTHDACHTRAADVPLPQSSFANTWNIIADHTADFAEYQTAPRLQSPSSQRYPFVRTGKVDVSGGHHDAGDYSKYTINSAGMIHYLMFAVDAFEGVAALDNLGIPESGDGVSDVMQEAKWEADFLSKMQDSDGGFYFLVYPRDREYESDVLPDQGDPQVVWPKNSATTAAAIAALAQCASSPRFRAAYPAEAGRYLQKAQLGWAFLMRAIDSYGVEGAYQKITHYGNQFAHNDELAWAACEMYLATGDAAYQQKLFEWLPNPNAPNIRRYGWWRLFESYGRAIRSYAFAEKSARLPVNSLNADYLARCQAEVLAAGDDHVFRAANNAYGTSFPLESKRHRVAGWYFPNERAFDIAAAWQLEARPEYIDAIVANLNFEAGCNPVNVCYMAGLGWKRQRERVHQYAHNDRRILPPSGFPFGSIQPGFPSFSPYNDELTALSFPQDNAAVAPYPFYDRWADSWNGSTEFVVLDLARSLGTLAFLAARTPLKTQPWKSVPAQIAIPSEIPLHTAVTATLSAPGLDLSRAHIIWEVGNANWTTEPFSGTANYIVGAGEAGPYWIEAEACLPDGRRVFAAANYAAVNSTPPATLAEAIDTGNPISTGSPAWIPQNDVSHDGEDAAQSGVVARGQKSRMTTTVQGPGTVNFWWKASSSDSDDKLLFIVNGSQKKSLSGNKDWQFVTYSLSSGTQTLRWEYARDSSSSGTNPRGWVDQFDYVSLADALDLSTQWRTSGSPPWMGQRNVTIDGEDAAQSAATSHGSSTSVQTTVAGPGVVRFWWKVSSELNNDSLRFYIGSSEKARISGENDWHQREFNVPSGTQTLKWTYKKSSSTSRGADRGWVDQVEFPAIAVFAAAQQRASMENTQLITVQIGMSAESVLLSWACNPTKRYKVLYKESLSAIEWKVLPHTVLMTNGLAAVADSLNSRRQRFYVVFEE